MATDLSTSADVLRPSASTASMPRASGMGRASGMERASEMGRAKMRHSMWVRTCRDFLKCHRRPINVALHVITTPMGLVGFLGLLGRINPLAMTAVAAIYMAALWPLVPKRVWFVTTIVVAAMVAGVMIWNPVWWIALVTLVLGYVGQETAHLVAGEATLQSTYIQTDQRFKRFAEHTLLLLPVLLVIASRPKQSPLRLFVARDAVLATKLTAPDPKQDLKSIRDWVREKHPTVEQSTHWWQSDLDDAAGDAFERLSHDPTLISMIRRFHGTGYTVEPVLGMNELYVTGPPKQRSSDTVFYRGHVDGPWAVFPGARLYRCMLAASPNAEVTTHFPMMGTDYEKPHGFRLEDGDAVAFDFNRELHYITRDVFAAQQEPRVNLKLHFVAYPTALPFYGKMLADWTTNYDIRARNLFLNTIAPDSRLARLKAGWVLGWTKIFESAVHYVGWTNLAYVASMATIGMALQSLTWFLLATSFVHYLIYLGTIREPTQVSFGTFRRDAVFFKAVSMTSLFGIYAANFGGQWLSLACVVTGFALATYATSVLGVNRTYFSTELGFDTPQRATRWPYNMIPHPMILGALLGIASMSLVPSMREQYGWLIATHLAFYLVVLFQEIVVWSNSTRRPDNTTFGTIARPRPNAACDDFLESLRTPKSRDARHEK